MPSHTIMSPSPSPKLTDDLLTLLVDHYLSFGAGYSLEERDRALNNASLTCRTLADATRKHIFQTITIEIGPDFTPQQQLSQSQTLKEIIEAKPQYLELVRELRLKGSMSIFEEKDGDGSSMTPVYTSSVEEDEAICWILSQPFLKLESFGFSLFAQMNKPAWPTSPHHSMFQATLLTLLGKATFRNLDFTCNVPLLTLSFCKEAFLRRLTVRPQPKGTFGIMGESWPPPHLFLFAKVSGIDSPTQNGPRLIPLPGVDLRGEWDRAPSASERVRLEEMWFYETDTSSDIDGWVKGPRTWIDIECLKSLDLVQEKTGGWRAPWSELPAFPLQTCTNLERLRFWGARSCYRGKLDEHRLRLKKLRELTYAIDGFKDDEWEQFAPVARSILELGNTDFLLEPMGVAAPGGARWKGFDDFTPLRLELSEGNLPSLERLDVIFKLPKTWKATSDPKLDTLLLLADTHLHASLSKSKIGESLKEVRVVVCLQNEGWPVEDWVEGPQSANYRGAEEKIWTQFPQLTRGCSWIDLDVRVVSSRAFPWWN